MRKWMRERLSRRKKASEEAAKEPPLAPLQPAFYGSETEKQPAPAEDSHGEENQVEPPAELNASAEKQPSSSAGGNGDNQRRRRRRGRGGRGRGAKPQAAPAKLAEAVPVVAEAAIPTAPPRPPKGTVVLAIGLPGSGKSSWFKRNNITPLSSDVLRALLFDDPTEQRYQDLIFSNLRSMLKARLIARRPMNYVDSTNLTPQERAGWIKLAKDYGYEVQAVVFDVPLETCLARNQKRNRVVPEEAMRRMAAKLKAPTFDEGFSKITVVRVKQKDSGNS